MNKRKISTQKRTAFIASLSKIRKMKQFKILILFSIIISSCEKKQESFAYKATVVGMDDCAIYHILNLHKLNQNAELADGIYCVYDLRSKFVGELPSFNYGYEGLRIEVTSSGLSNSKSFCNFMGKKLPIVNISKAKIDDNQEENIDQRKINNSNICLPYRKVHGTTEYDIDGDSAFDISFNFMNWISSKEDSVFTFSDLTMWTRGNFTNYENGNYSIKQIGDTIKSAGPITGDWDRGFAGTYLVKYHHNNATWDESILKFGKSVYLIFQIQKEDQFHTAWVELLIDNYDCKCVVSILDSYYNPIPSTPSIVGEK